MVKVVRLPADPQSFLNLSPLGLHYLDAKILDPPLDLTAGESSSELTISPAEFLSGYINLQIPLPDNEAPPVIASSIFLRTQGIDHLLLATGAQIGEDPNTVMSASTTLAYQLLSAQGVPKITQEGIVSFQKIANALSLMEEVITPKVPLSDVGDALDLKTIIAARRF